MKGHHPRFLGVTRPQMGVIVALGALTYFLCQFQFESQTSVPFLGATLREYLTYGIMILIWIVQAVYNRLHPDEEIRLNLDK